MVRDVKFCFGPTGYFVIIELLQCSICSQFLFEWIVWGCWEWYQALLTAGVTGSASDIATILNSRVNGIAHPSVLKSYQQYLLVINIMSFIKSHYSSVHVMISTLYFLTIFNDHFYCSTIFSDHYGLNLFFTGLFGAFSPKPFYTKIALKSP